MTLSRPKRGELVVGSFSITSSAAPAISFLSRASARAASSMIGPRAVLITIGRWLHALEDVGIEQVMRCGHERRVNGDVVGNSHEFVEFHAIDSRFREHFLRDVGIESDDAHAERFCLGRDELGNLAEGDQPEHRTAKTMNRHRRLHFPSAGTGACVQKRDFSHDGEKQGHGVIGNFIEAIVRDARDDNSLSRGRGNIHVVHANAKAADDAAATELRDHLAVTLA